MDLYRFRLVPESPWRTPWQSDTLAGLLCWMCARPRAMTVLRQQMIEPALAGRPPFVLSDAFPGERLPLPAAVRLLEVPAEHRKTVKRAKWLSRESFATAPARRTARDGRIDPRPGIREYTQLRNTIGRSSNTTTTAAVCSRPRNPCSKRACSYLTVYARVEPGFV